MRKETISRPYKLIVTRIVSEHSTDRAARAALRKLKPQRGALGVVVKVKTKGM